MPKSFLPTQNPPAEKFTFLLCGVDTLDLGLYVSWDSGWGAAVSALDAQKEQAQGTKGILDVTSDAVDQFRWTLPSPFVIVKKHLPKSPAKKREGFRFDEWQEFLTHVEPWYQPVVELMIMTGMIHSELAGLRKADIRADYILVQNTVVRMREKDSPKYDHRIRKVHITPGYQEAA